MRVYIFNKVHNMKNVRIIMYIILNAEGMYNIVYIIKKGVIKSFVVVSEFVVLAPF